MTNKEFLIACMNGKIDDGGSAWEASLHYHIACPYFAGDERAYCHENEDNIGRDLCVRCKANWLDSEVDE